MRVADRRRPRQRSRAQQEPGAMQKDLRRGRRKAPASVRLKPSQAAAESPRYASSRAETNRASAPSRPAKAAIASACSPDPSAGRQGGWQWPRPDRPKNLGRNGRSRPCLRRANTAGSARPSTYSARSLAEASPSCGVLRHRRRMHSTKSPAFLIADDFVGGETEVELLFDRQDQLAPGHRIPDRRSPAARSPG